MTPHFQISTTTILDLGGENVVKLSLQLASTERLDGCFDYTGPSVQVNSALFPLCRNIMHSGHKWNVISLYPTRYMCAFTDY